jgi:hypothetical protein
MESSVTSQISPKLYSGDIKKLYKDDVDAQSELFEINIFNHTLHIAPGKSIADEEHDKLVYFYVYAIKDEKVIANLGVYELLTDEQKLMYDISSFENLLLFDYYYTNPGVIKEFEISGKNNIFDYIDTHLTPDPKFVEIYNTFTRYGKENKEFLGKHYASYKKIISILSKDIKKGIGGKIMELKDNCKNVDVYKLTLAILEPFYNVQFSLLDEGVSVTNFRDKTPPQTFSPKQYIIASTDQSFVSTASTQPGAGADEAEDGKGEAEGGEATEATEATEAPEEDVADLEVDEDTGEVKSLKSKNTDSKMKSNGESSASALEKEGGNDFNVGFKPKLKGPKGIRIPGIKSKNRGSRDNSKSENEKSESKSSKLDNSSKLQNLESKQGESKESKQGESKESKQSESKESKQDESKESKQHESKESKQDESKESKQDESKFSRPRIRLSTSSVLGQSLQPALTDLKVRESGKPDEDKSRSRLTPRPRQRSPSPAPAPASASSASATSEEEPKQRSKIGFKPKS